MFTKYYGNFFLLGEGFLCSEAEKKTGGVEHKESKLGNNQYGSRIDGARIPVKSKSKSIALESTIQCNPRREAPTSVKKYIFVLYYLLKTCFIITSDRHFPYQKEKGR